MQSCILLVDDETNALISMEMTLKMEGISCIHSFNNSREALKSIQEKNYDLAILDLMMPEISGMELLGKIKEKSPDTGVIMATALDDVESAVSCLKAGASDYILKPLDSERFVNSVKTALKFQEIQKDCQRIRDHLFSDRVDNPSVFSKLVTQHPKMQLLFKYIEAIGPTEYGILVTGETGAGKELIAEAIHAVSQRKGKFMAVNAGGLDDTLFSDTLFGHVKGAFTGAETSRAGLIEQAEDGTLFLDEIGDLSPVSQIKLLRLIQEREYSPLGSDKLKPCKARIVAATLKSAQELKDSPAFRKDLFYRLQTHHIHLPPLRERKEDIPLLVQCFVDKACQDLHKTFPVIPYELFDLLNKYPFPGNVRELQGLVYDAISQNESGTLSLRSFKNKIFPEMSDELEKPVSVAVKEMEFPEKLPTLDEMEDRVVEEALKRSGGNQTLAASLLGITRQSLSYRIKTRNLKI